jgi:hypothetical protein
VHQHPVLVARALRAQRVEAGTHRLGARRATAACVRLGREQGLEMAVLGRDHHQGQRQLGNGRQRRQRVRQQRPPRQLDVLLGQRLAGAAAAAGGGHKGEAAAHSSTMS